jgi:hypothetical protein
MVGERSSATHSGRVDCFVSYISGNDVSITKDAIRAYFKVKNGAPGIFNNRDLDREELQKTLKVM